jgi:nitrogenase molybdenum-iron protein alpha/beta subunit
MNARIQTMPGTFPLHENRDFLRESEWVILKLLCRPVDSLATADADELSSASGGQLSPERCQQLINMVRISNLPGLGTWIARLISEAGLDVEAVLTLSAEEIARHVNAHAGYPICNPATTHAIAGLHASWPNGTGESLR